MNTLVGSLTERDTQTVSVLKLKKLKLKHTLINIFRSEIFSVKPREDIIVRNALFEITSLTTTRNICVTFQSENLINNFIKSASAYRVTHKEKYSETTVRNLYGLLFYIHDSLTLQNCFFI